MDLSIEDLQQHFQAAGLSGASVCVHASIKSLGPLTHGPETVIESALLADLTVLVSTQSWKHFAAPKPTHRADIALNAEDDGSIPLTLPNNGGFRENRHWLVPLWVFCRRFWLRNFLINEVIIPLHPFLPLDRVRIF